VVSDERLARIDGAAAQRLLEAETRLVVTGAGGWLGLATLEMLHGLLGRAFSRRVVALGARPRRLLLRGGVEVSQASLSALDDLPPAPSLVIHLGFLTQGPQMTLTAEDYVAANTAIRKRLLFALDRIGAEGLFLASSGAAYRADPAGGAQSKELYGWLKRQDEAEFGLWGEDSGRPVVAARIFNLSGPYINRRSTYALASFIADALAGRPITVRADRRVYRSFTAIEELMSVALGALTQAGGRSVAFDTAGEGALEMEDLAHAVARALGAPDVVVRPSLDREAAPDRYVGDGAAYTMLGLRLGVARRSLDDQVRQTAAFMDRHPQAA
jgi:UDP-glucuronate decarboxylase